MDDRAVEGPPIELGLQNERTTLAWRRTNLALLGTAAIGAKAADSTVVGLAIVVAALALVSVAGLGIDRRHRTRHAEVGPACVTPAGAPAPELAAPGAMVALTGLVLVLAVGAVVLIVV